MKLYLRLLYFSVAVVFVASSTATNPPNYRVASLNFEQINRSSQSNPRPASYSVIDLGVEAEPRRITNSRYILFRPQLNNGWKTYRWHDGVFETLQGEALAINDSGKAVGRIVT